MKRVYISGPMTNMPQLNFPAFRAAAAQLRSVGLEVVNPAELDEQDAGKEMAWADYMRRDIKALMDCTHVAVLPGWQESKGASIEVGLAHALGIQVERVEAMVARHSRGEVAA